MIYSSIDKPKLKTNICIIGSGIGGGTIADHLSDSDKHITIIEAGNFNKSSSNVKHVSVGREFGIRTTRAIKVGGTSNLWHGVLAPLDSIDFTKRDWIEHSGWPISLDDLKPFYNKAYKLLGVDNPELYDTGSFSVDLQKQLNSVSFSKNYLEHKVFQQPIPSKNFSKVVEENFKESNKRNIFCNSVALELISEQDHIKSLKVGNPDGSFSYIEAEVFIISSGALETPRLLLNSNIKNNNIGRYLMDHPMGNLCQMEFLKPIKSQIYSDYKYSKNIKIKVGFEMNDYMQESLKLPNHCFYLRPSFVKGINNESEKIKMALLSFRDGKVSFADIFKLISNPNAAKQILTYKFSLDVILKYTDLFFVTEQTPNPNSRVNLSEKIDKWSYRQSQVDWQISKYDVDSVRNFYKLLLRNLFPKELYKFTHTLDDFSWEDTFTSAIHHVGTARMGKNRNEAVVDKNLKVFDKENLYVCDGSVFPTAGNVNNGLTISALGIRLAEHLLLSR